MPTANLEAREVDLFNSEHLKKIIAEIDGDQNTARKKHAWVTNQCLEGNQIEYVKDALKVTYPKTHHKFRVGDISLVAKVEKKLSKSYKSSPIREASSDVESEVLADIYKNNHFERAFKEADSIFNIHKYVCLWLTFQNEDAKLGIPEFNYVLHALKPYEYDLIRDQVTGAPVVFIQNYPESRVTELAGNSDGLEQTISESQSDTSAQTRIYVFWNDTQYAKVAVKQVSIEGHKDKSMQLDFIDQKPNVIGRLPIAYLQADTATDYPIKQNLAAQSIDWNVSLSDIKTAASAQGHGQLVITHPEGQELKNVHMGMHTAITLPQSKKPNMPDTDAKYINAGPDLAGQLDVLKFDVINILDDHGIKAAGALEGGLDKFTSGFDRLLSEADVQDIIENNQSLFADTLEAGVFDILKASEAAMSQNTFSKTEALQVTFEKPKVLISDKETLENIKLREELNTILPWEKHIILNPNLTEKQAKAREDELSKLADEKLLKQIELMGGEESEDEDDEIKKGDDKKEGF